MLQIWNYVLGIQRNIPESPALWKKILKNENDGNFSVMAIPW
jgi:hypothetical protein